MRSTEGLPTSTPQERAKLYAAMAEEFHRLADEYTELARAATAQAEGTPLLDGLNDKGGKQ